MAIVSGPLKRSALDAVCAEARRFGVSVLYTHSTGFYSSLSLQVAAEFPIVETHPDPETTQDLRLVNPWPELLAAAARVDNLDSLDDHVHGHVPYVLLILHFLERWRMAHDGKVPANYKEKSEFRELVRSGARVNNAEGGEENFDEAVAAVLKALNPFTLRGSLREIFEMDECRNIKVDAANFWLIASAVKAFYERYGVLPLPGSLPDMKAQSEDYISLQNVYKAKSKQDLSEVVELVRKLEAQLGRDEAVPESEIEVFSKNAAHIKVVHGRDIPQVDNTSVSKLVQSHLDSSESLMHIFVAFQVLDSVVSEIQEGRGQKSFNDNTVWKTQLDRIAGYMSDVDEDADERISQAIEELRRADGGELHNISALTGGMVAQEAVKVITRQYVPLDNTCIFDGVHSRSEMVKL